MGKKKHLRAGAEKRFEITREKFDERLTSQGVLKMRFDNKKSGKTIGEIILECTRSRRKLAKKPDKKPQIKVNRDCSVTFQNSWLPFVPLEMCSYTRTCKGEDENYKYFELHRESSIISYIGEKDKVLKSIIKRENLNDAQGKMLKRALEHTQGSVRPLDPVYKDFTYHWLEKYKPKKSPKLMGFESNMLLDCPKLNVVYSILGYSLLAYIRTKYKIGTKIIPINFVTDKESAEILKEIIGGCFVWTGERDDENILEVVASSKTVIPERLTEGRCVIVNAMGKDKSTLESTMPLYFEYYNENERPVVFPYAFLPIIISDKPMGKEFMDIDAKGLNDYDWYPISEILNKVYESPIYLDFNRKEEKRKSIRRLIQGSRRNIKCRSNL